MSEPKNVRVRKAMAERSMNQSDLAKLLGVSEIEVSYMLKRELAKKEQDDIIATIRGA